MVWQQHQILLDFATSETKTQVCLYICGLTKSVKHRKICMHQYVLLCILKSSGETSGASGSPNETVNSNPSVASGSSNEMATFSTPSVASKLCNETVSFSSPSAASTCLSHETVVTSTSQYSEVARQHATLQLKMQLSLPYDISKEILQTILRLDSQTFLNGLVRDGWSSIFEPKEEICPLCGASLSSAHPHPGQKTGDSGLLITNTVAFQKITIALSEV